MGAVDFVVSKNKVTVGAGSVEVVLELEGVELGAGVGALLEELTMVPFAMTSVS